jgi:hypothetical protein
MEIGIIILTIGAYGLAGYIAWRERSTIYVVALFAGQLSALPSPLWQLLYGFRYDERLPTMLTFFDRSLPWVIFLGAWLVVLPPLVILYLIQQRLWFSGYITGVLTFTLFVLFHVLLETVGANARLWAYIDRGPLPFGVPANLYAALSHGLVSLGTLAALIFTRHYSLGSQLIFLVPVPIGLSLVVHGLLGAPLYTVLLLRAQSWAGVIGMAGTLGLIIWATHIVASELGRQRDTRIGTAT